MCPLKGSKIRANDVRSLIQLARKYNGYYYADDAHGTSLIGEKGCGYTLYQLGEFSENLILLSSLSKAFGSHGGSASFSHSQAAYFIKKYSLNYVFSGPPSLPGTAACVASANIHLSPEIVELQTKLRDNIFYFDNIVKNVEVKEKLSPIRTILIGSEDEAMNMSTELRKRGFLATAAMYPTVPKNESIIRVAISAAHSKSDINNFADTINELTEKKIMLTEVITAYRQSTALHAFVTTGAPVCIGANGFISLKELSIACEVDEKRLSRLIDIMIELGIVAFENDCYSLTKKSVALADENSLEALWVTCELGEYYWKMWPKYTQSLRIGSQSSAFEKEHGTNFFEFMKTQPELKNNFDKLMASITEKLSTELVELFECNENTEIVDIGGGKGILARKISEKFNNKNCSVIDFYQKSISYAKGVKYINGDFFESIVPGKDIYILKNILHDWNDDNAIKILENCHNAMTEHSILYIIEIIKVTDSSQGKTLDLLMDALFLGKERYLHEYEMLATTCHFRIDNVIKTSFSQSVMIWKKGKS